jgi:starch phosphorylase
MKLPPNGGLNLSVLDGWWCEASNGKNGWNIGAEIPTTTKMLDSDYENQVDTASLLHTLETKVIPLFYAKPDGKLPIAWLQLMRDSIRTIVPVFNTHRMVKEYAERLYEPAARAHIELASNDCAKATALSQWKDKMRADWPTVRISEVQVTNADLSKILVGDTLEISVKVHLGTVDPKFVQVQAYVGESKDGDLTKTVARDLSNAEKLGTPGDYLYKGTISAPDSGTYGFNVRVIPTHPNLTQAHELRLITWAK